MTGAWSAGPRPLTSPTSAPGAWTFLARDCLSGRGCYSGWAAVAPAEQTSTGCRHWWAGTVARPTSVPVLSVVHASGRCHSSLRVQKLRLSVRAYSERERRAGGEVPLNLPCPVSRSQSRTSMKDTHPLKLYTPPGMCGDVMYVMYAVRYVGWTAIMRNLWYCNC